MIKQLRLCSIFSLLLLLSSCTSGYIQVEKVKTDRATYASRFAKSPDDRALNPPKGEKLYINWSLPMTFTSDMYRLKMDIVYRDLTTETLLFPLKRRAGSRIIEMLGDDFKEKKGFLSYRAEVLSVDGKVVSDYTHRMWVKLILPCGGEQ